jgi:hypothetical protein
VQTGAGPYRLRRDAHDDGLYTGNHAVQIFPQLDLILQRALTKHPVTDGKAVQMDTTEVKLAARTLALAKLRSKREERSSKREKDEEKVDKEEEPAAAGVGDEGEDGSNDVIFIDTWKKYPPVMWSEADGDCCQCFMCEAWFLCSATGLTIEEVSEDTTWSCDLCGPAPLNGSVSGSINGLPTEASSPLRNGSLNGSPTEAASPLNGSLSGSLIGSPIGAAPPPLNESLNGSLNGSPTEAASPPLNSSLSGSLIGSPTEAAPPLNESLNGSLSGSPTEDVSAPPAMDPRLPACRVKLHEILYAYLMVNPVDGTGLLNGLSCSPHCGKAWFNQICGAGRHNPLLVNGRSIGGWLLMEAVLGKMNLIDTEGVWDPARQLIAQDFIDSNYSKMDVRRFVRACHPTSGAFLRACGKGVWSDYAIPGFETPRGEFEALAWVLDQMRIIFVDFCFSRKVIHSRGHPLWIAAKAAFFNVFEWYVIIILLLSSS